MAVAGKRAYPSVAEKNLRSNGLVLIASDEQHAFIERRDELQPGTHPVFLAVGMCHSIASYYTSLVLPLVLLIYSRQGKSKPSKARKCILPSRDGKMSHQQRTSMGCID